MNKVVKFAKNLMTNMKQDAVAPVSAQCAYYTILSFIPFLIVTLTLIQYTNVDPETMYSFLSKLIPSTMRGVIFSIIDEVYSRSIGTISISLIFVFYSASQGLYALTSGLQNIYKTKEEEKSAFLNLRFKTFCETILFIILIVLSLVISVFGKSVISIIQNKIGVLENNAIISFIVVQLGIYIISFLVLLMLYAFVPRHKLKIKDQIIGALIAVIIIEISSFIFSEYLGIFKNFSIMYGSLTTLMLIMMWIYVVFYAIFIGAEINKMIRKNKKTKTKTKTYININAKK